SIFGTDLVKESSEGIHTKNGITRPTTIVLEDSVYVLLGNYSHTRPKVEGKNERGLLLVRGTLTDEGGKKKIRWNETHVVKPQAHRYYHPLTELVGGGGTGAVMRDGTLVFPMQAKKRDGTRFLLSMHFPNSGNKWELSLETPGKGCRDPTLVKWEEDEYGQDLLMMAHCAGGYYDVYRSIADGVNWYTWGEPINRVWGNSRDRAGEGVKSGSTTAIIEGKNVMLITAPVYPKEENKGGKGRLHLWVTDNARVYDVGPISREQDDAAASSLLMQSGNEKLISVYENKKKEDGSYNLVAVNLREQLKRIKEVVKKWAALDSALQSCSLGTSGTVDARKKGMCADRVPTDRLVGLLSGNSIGTEWKDEYLGVNATVHGEVTRISNGWTFKKSGAGALWPVGDMGQTVPYYFANNEFTLVATVSIHEVPKESSSPIPLIGVRMNDTESSVLFGLSYTYDKKFLAIPESRDGVMDFIEWKPNTTYQVGMRMDTVSWSVFVDGEEIQEKRYSADLFESNRISHFYIGGDSKDQRATGGHVTVTNVMLYNKKLSGGVLDKLEQSKVTIQSLGAEKQPTEQAASTRNSVASDSMSEESAKSHKELTEYGADEQEENVQNPVPAENPSTVVAESSVSEPITAAESAENSRSGVNAQLSEGEKSQEATLNEDNESMQRDSEGQPQDSQSVESREATDFDASSGSNDTEQPVEEGKADDRSGGSTSSVAA
ncbi:trans-sialidase, putative, partial [Trypanosoma cruzi marinkellei]